MAAVIEDQFAETKAWFDLLFAKHEDGLNGQKNHPLYQLQRNSLQKVKEMAFPTRRDEDWKYTSVNRILQVKYKEGKAEKLSAEQLKPYIFEGLNAIQLVFVNGVFDESLSSRQELPEDVEFKLLGDALLDERQHQMIYKQIAREGTTKQNPFLPLNLAFAKNGVVITVPKNYRLERPLHFLHIATENEEPIFFHPQIIIKANSGSEMQFIESYHALADHKGSYFANSANWLELRENAIIHHYRIQDHGENAYQINNTIVNQDRDSVYSSYAVDLGGRLVRNNISALLQASGIEAHLYGIYLADKDQHIDNQTFMDHAFPHCNSNELYKGILNDKARGVFNGKVLVRPDAQKTNAFQQNSSLVLSSKAMMDTKPQLEIFADDVRCSHGATIGQLDEQAVFYLRSRGLSTEQARSMLQQAFVGEVIEHMKLEPVRKKVLQMIVEKLKIEEPLL